MARGNDITLSLGDELSFLQECDSRARSVCVRVALKAHSADVWDALGVLRNAGISSGEALEQLGAAPGRGRRYDTVEILRAFDLLKGSPLGRARVIAWVRDDAAEKAAQ